MFLLWITNLLAITGIACAFGDGNRSGKPATEADEFKPRRIAMVASQIEARRVRDPQVLEAMRRVQRHRFVPEKLQSQAYDDHPLAIGHDQTISQPYIVALMTELIRPEPKMKVLEVGTGSGYQAAVLAECAGQVFSIEIVPALGTAATELLRSLGYDNVQVRIGDGFDGWPEQAPFDAILVTAAPETIPQPLLDQLAVGGRLVIPVGGFAQNLIVVERTQDGYERRVITPVRFVPMTGKAQDR